MRDFLKGVVVGLLIAALPLFSAMTGMKSELYDYLSVAMICGILTASVYLSPERRFRELRSLG